MQVLFGPTVQLYLPKNHPFEQRKWTLEQKIEMLNIQVMQHCNRGRMQGFATFLFQFAAFIRLKPGNCTMQAMARRKYQYPYQYQYQ